MSKSYWMKDQNGNFSNDGIDTFEERKRYIGVRLQQGVPLLDRDWNELEDIRRYEEMITRKHYIGDGTPDDGFRISATSPEANDFLIGKGRYLVKGFEVVNDPGLSDFSVTSYTDQIKKDDTLPPLPTNPDNVVREDYVYLDVWIEEVNKAKDDRLSNSQDLNEETSVRHKINWRVRVSERVKPKDSSGFHHYCCLAKINRKQNVQEIHASDIEDMREGRGNELLTVSRLKVGSHGIETGTTNPAYDLDVSAKTIKLGLEKNGGGQLIIKNNPPQRGVREDAIYIEAYDSEGSGTAKALSITGPDNSLNIQELYLNADKTIFNGIPGKPGNVGIGTTSPEFTLHVKGKIKIEDGEIIQDAWTNVTFEAGFKDFNEGYNPTSYFRDKNGIVHLQGAVCVSEDIEKSDDNITIFKLNNKKYQPQCIEIRMVVQKSYNNESKKYSYDYNYCEIFQDGRVTYTNKLNMNDLLILDGITFKAGD